jgi:hypothetical protein
MSDDHRRGRRLATVKEACAYAKMGQTKLYAKINAGVILAFKHDRKTVVDLDSVDVMLDSELVPWGGPVNPRISGPT